MVPAPSVTAAAGNPGLRRTLKLSPGSAGTVLRSTHDVCHECGMGWSSTRATRFQPDGDWGLAWRQLFSLLNLDRAGGSSHRYPTSDSVPQHALQ